MRSIPDSHRLPAASRRGSARAAAAALGLAAAAALLGCERNAAVTLLTPSGERPQPAIGAIHGRVDFGDGTFPATLVLVARVRDCTSAFTSLQVVGTPTGFNIGASPHLTQLAPCAWIDTVSIPAGRLEWKFVTNGDFDSSPDYGSPGSQVDGLSGNATLGAPGEDGNLAANVTAGQAGLQVVTLEEGTQPAPYRFERIGAASMARFTSTADGSFSFTGLPLGRYHVLIRPEGRAPRTLTNVAAAETPTQLGTISFGSGNPGAVSGRLAFDPVVFPDLADPPYPPATVELFLDAFRVATTQTTRQDPSFRFSGLAPGTYRVVADARLFAPTARETIAVAGAPRDLGTVTLPFDFTELTSVIHLASDFFGFPPEPLPGHLEMAQTAQYGIGVWVHPPPDSTPRSIAAGTYNMKFVTDGAYDNPTDYGGDEGTVIAVPAVHVPTRLVSGLGTALRVQIPATGTYRFLLDERRQTFTVEALSAAARRLTAWERVRAAAGRPR